MKVSRDAIIVVILFAILIGVAGYGASRQVKAEAQYPPGSIQSTQPNGGRALYLWLREMGYPTSVIEGSRFSIGRNVKLLLMLAPSANTGLEFGWGQTSAINDWVMEGGTLVIAQPGGWDTLLQRFDFQIQWRNAGLLKQATLVQPLLVSSPFITATINSLYYLQDDSPDQSIVHLSAEKKPVLASRKVGQGQVMVVSGLYPFTNEGLHDTANAALVYNLILTGAGTHGPIAFDEYHHGVRNEASLQTWLVSTPPGWAILYGALVVFAYLLIGGRRFGAPVPLPEHIARRTTAEYISAMANLRRRAGHRSDALRHYKEQLKRRLSRPFRLDPHLADDQFVEELARCEPAHASRRTELERLLRELGRKRVHEREMVKLAGEAAEWPKQ